MIAFARRSALAWLMLGACLGAQATAPLPYQSADQSLGTVNMVASGSSISAV